MIFQRHIHDDCITTVLVERAASRLWSVNITSIRLAMIWPKQETPFELFIWGFTSFLFRFAHRIISISSWTVPLLHMTAFMYFFFLSFSFSLCAPFCWVFVCYLLLSLVYSLNAIFAVAHFIQVNAFVLLLKCGLFITSNWSLVPLNAEHLFRTSACSRVHDAFSI